MEKGGREGGRKEMREKIKEGREIEKCCVERERNKEEENIRREKRK